MRPLFRIKQFRGINDRTSPRDLGEGQLVTCDNWEVDNVMGNLVLGKGYSKYKTDDLGDSAGSLIEYENVRDNEKKIMAVQLNDSTMRTYNTLAGLGSSQDHYASTIGGSFDKIRFDQRNGALFGGCGHSADNIPFWYGKRVARRFYNGATWAQGEGEYVFQQEKLRIPTISSLLTNGADIVFANFSASGSGSLPDTVYIVATYLYMDGQESAFPIDDAGKFSSAALGFGSPGSETYTWNVYVNPSLLPSNAVGINVYISTTSSADGYKYFETLYFDETKKVFDAGYSGSHYDIWQYDSGSGHYYYEKYYGNTKTINYEITSDDLTNLTYLIDRIDYPITNTTMPNYSFSTDLMGVRYVGGALYPKVSFIYSPSLEIDFEYDENDYEPDIIYFSAQDQPNTIPITNYIKAREAVTGLGHTSTQLLIFGENSLGVYTPGSGFNDDFAKTGCVSHDSIVGYNGMVFWAGKSSIYMFDRFFPTDIASYKIRDLYSGISQSAKEQAVGTFDVVNNEYVLTIPGTKVLKYNIVTNEWTVKSIPLHTVISGIDQNLYGIAGNTHRFIVDYQSGYSTIDVSDGTTDYYTATAKTKVLTGEEAENIIKSLSMGFCSFKASNSLLINVYVDGVIADSVILDAQTTMKPVEFHMGGVMAENIQLEFKLTTTADTEVGEIDFIKIFGNVHEIQGG